jgi:polysaccharide export outer membrane protein
MRRTTLALVALAIAISGSPALGARQTQDSSDAKTSDPDARPAEPASRTAGAPGAIAVELGRDYEIGARDVIDVAVDDAPELSGVYEVNAAGTFLMPYLGRVRAAGVTPEALAERIADGLRGRYIKSPSVFVSVRQFRSRSFFIQGSVRSPGVYQLEGTPTLLRLISLAGGLTPDHGSSANILREHAAPEPEPSGTDGAAPAERAVDVISVKLAGVFASDTDAAVLRPGDIVDVPQAAVFFVAGEVRSPGSFRLKEGTTLRQAISLAQGMTVRAASGRGVIFREDPAGGKRTEIAVDIGDVMQGKRDDVAIHENDIIIVPNSKAKTVGSALLAALGLGAAARVPM